MAASGSVYSVGGSALAFRLLTVFLRMSIDEETPLSTNVGECLFVVSELSLGGIT